jgi:adenosylhomocysteine nucleosidase
MVARFGGPAAVGYRLLAFGFWTKGLMHNSRMTATQASSPSAAAGPLAILSALPDEQRGLIELLQSPRLERHAGREFWRGSLHGQTVVLALSRIGKVSATLTAAVLVERFGVRAIVFTGVAGGLAPGVRVGDVVVAHEFMQHDMDASPIFPRHEVPAYGRSRFACDAELSERLALAAGRGLAQAFGSAQIHRGLIASGDRFVSSAAESSALQLALRQTGHEALAVEMEGAAVAQVCADYGIAFAAMRTISDRADDDAHQDFSTFVRQVASRYALLIVGEFLRPGHAA